MTYPEDRTALLQDRHQQESPALYHRYDLDLDDAIEIAEKTI
ncbi:hypothetical protein [Hyphomicrobium sp. 2TAF46]